MTEIFYFRFMIKIIKIANNIHREIFSFMNKESWATI